MSPGTLVLGGGLSGLLTALLLARRGRQVDLLERDRSAVPTGVRAAGGWHRPSVPQGAHSHAVLALGRRLLAAEAPDVLDALREAGVREIALRPPPTLLYDPAPVPDLVVLAARRPVVEWVLRRAVERERGVRVHPGAEATGLVESRGRLAGIRVDGGVVDADIAVDATGAGSPVPGWLAARGRPVPERAVPGAATYYTRFWVLHRSADPGVLDQGHTAGGTFDGYSCQVYPADNGTFSVTFAVPPDDPELAALRGTEAFDAAAGRIPPVSCWVDSAVAVPISGVSVTGAPGDRLRVLAPSGVPVLPGLLAAGDAVCTTEPVHGRGIALGWESALAGVRAVLEHGADQEAVTAAADAAQQRVLVPWFEDSAPSGARSPAGTGACAPADAALAAQRDPQVWARFTAMRNLLCTPDEVLGDRETLRRVRAILDGPWRPEPVGAPSRDELAAVVRSAPSRHPARVAG